MDRQRNSFNLTWRCTKTTIVEQINRVPCVHTTWVFILIRADNWNGASIDSTIFAQYIQATWRAICRNKPHLYIMCRQYSLINRKNKHFMFIAVSVYSKIYVYGTMGEILVDKHIQTNLQTSWLQHFAHFIASYLQATSAEATWPGPLRNPIQTFQVRIYLKF